MKNILLIIPALMLMGCSKKTTQTASEPMPEPETFQVVQPANSRPITMILKATAFQMSGDYSNNVAVTLNDDGSLAYYPAPSDITSDSRPIDLGNGWWLNRQGLGPNSVFTSYTFDEYMALPSVPSVEELKTKIIPGAKVTDWKRLSYPAGEAMKYLPQIKEEVK